MILSSKPSRSFSSVVLVAGLVGLVACATAAPRQHGALSDSVETVFSAIDVRVRASMARDATPGLALGLTTSEGLVGVWTWGYADLKLETPVTGETLFQIGSVSKSFTALALMQLWDEGRLKLEAPVTDYLPWWRVESDFEPIRVEHLLTHTAGIPANRDDIFSSPYMAWAVREQHAAWPPGSRHYYSNVGYQTLHFLLEAIAGEPYSDLIERRLLVPLEMRSSRAVITLDSRAEQAVGYIPRFDDRPTHRSRRLVEAPHHEYRIGDGSIQSTPADLAAYMRMWLNRGLRRGLDGDTGPGERIVSAEAFEKFSTPHPGSLDEDGARGYGYGVRVERRDNRLLLSHSGGMVGFESRVTADMTDGVGVVVLINGPGNTREVSEFALAAWRAMKLGEPMPEVPAPVDRTRVENAAEYAGSFTSGDDLGGVEFTADGDALWLEHGGARVRLERRGENLFYSPDPGFDRYMFEFGRNEAGRVVEVAHGPGWFVNDRYRGPSRFELPEAWTDYVGRYRNFSPWFPYFEVISRKGRLLALTGPGGESSVGETVLIPQGNGAFKPGEEPSPEVVRFEDVVEGRALRAVWSGHPFFRTAE